MRLVDIERMPDDAIGVDTETHCTGAGLATPPLVCASIGWLERGTPEEVPPSIRGRLLDEAAAVDVFQSLIGSGRPILVGANFGFDLAVFAVRLARQGIDVMPEIFRALEDEKRVFDIQIAEALDAVAEGCLGKDPRTGGELINPETGRRGRYSLSMCTSLVLGREDAKANDEWRRAYAQLHPFPIESWPETARQYPVDDAVNTIEISLAQAGHWPRIGAHRWSSEGGCEWCGLSPSDTVANGESVPCRAVRRSRNLHDLANQVCSDFALKIGAAWGFLIDQEYVDTIETHAIAGRDDADITKPFFDAGILRIKGGKVCKNMAVIAKRVALAYGASKDATCPTCDGTSKVSSPKNPKNKINCKDCGATGFQLEGLTSLPTTPKGKVSSGRDPLNESGDELLMEFAQYQEAAKTLQTYVPFLRRGRAPVAGHADACPMAVDEKEACTCPGPYRPIPLTLWPNVLLETGRVSYGGVIMMMPRKPRFRDKDDRWVPSLRECFRARPGWVFSSEDFEAGELITHGQSCIWITGSSALADALNDGRKVHNALGASMIGLDYDAFQAIVKTDRSCKDARQAAKPGNFGFPGGMGPVKMVQTQRKQGPDTPCPGGPSWIEVEDGHGGVERVRGYKGLRFCILMDGATACGVEKRLTYRDKPIAPTCAQCIACAIRLKDTWARQWPENVLYFEHVNDVIENGELITAEMLARWPHLQEWFYAGQRLAPGEALQHVSGRVRQCNTATTESPYCVSGDTLVHTAKGRVPAHTLAGSKVRVLSENGVYRWSTWKSHGVHPVFDVVFENGDTVRTTAEHRWKVVKPNGWPEWVTTSTLLGRNVPMQHISPSCRTIDQIPYLEGIRRGLIFGDGHVKQSNGNAEITQYGDSIHLIDDYFADRARHHKSKRYPDTGTAFAGGFPAEYKTVLPNVATHGSSYVFGFLAGYIGADGSVSRQGSITLSSSKREDLVAVRQLAADVGLPTLHIGITRHLNPWNGTPAPLYVLHFSKAGLDPRLIIKNAHKDKYDKSLKTNRRTRTKVVDVRPAGREEVFCCEEPETHTWVAGMGYLTGNCSMANGYFQGLLADAAKAALRRVSRECYDRTVRVPYMAYENSIPSRYARLESPLLGSRVITFQHDEILLEHPEAMGHDGATRVSEVMVDELRRYCPDLAPACKAEPTTMRRWVKGAAPVWARGGVKGQADADDRLVPYELPA